jgi:hypothetical protein
VISIKLIDPTLDVLVYKLYNAFSVIMSLVYFEMSVINYVDMIYYVFKEK